LVFGEFIIFLYLIEIDLVALRSSQYHFPVRYTYMQVLGMSGMYTECPASIMPISRREGSVTGQKPVFWRYTYKLKKIMQLVKIKCLKSKMFTKIKSLK